MNKKLSEIAHMLYKMFNVETGACQWRIGNSSSLPPPHNTPALLVLSSLSSTNFRYPPPYHCLGVRDDIILNFLTGLTGLTGPTSRNCTNSIRRHWHSTTLTAPCQRLHHTHPRRCASHTAPNSAAPPGTPQSALATGASFPRAP